MHKRIDRRSFFNNTVASAAGLLFSSDLIQSISKEPARDISLENKRMGLMEEVMKYRKIDTHAHVYFDVDSPARQLDYADRLGIEKLMISKNIEAFSKGTPDEFRKCNDLVMRCVKSHPDRLIGMMVLNPIYQKESLEEIKRCVDAGMVGIGELYNQIKINDPLYYPIIEKFIELKMIFMMHSGIGRSRVLLNEGEPKNLSLPEDFIDTAKRYPEAMIQFAHTAGGIDWEYACKSLSHSPNIYVDISGSNNEAGMIEFALKYFGEDRLFFGCDNSFYQGVGHVMAANLTEQQRKKIFFDNYNSILRKSGNHVD